jgi:hypothetical protein
MILYVGLRVREGLVSVSEWREVLTRWVGSLMKWRLVALRCDVNNIGYMERMRGPHMNRTWFR